MAAWGALRRVEVLASPVAYRPPALRYLRLLEVRGTALALAATRGR